MSDLIERATRHHNNLAPHVQERKTGMVLRELITHCRKLEEFSELVWDADEHQAREQCDELKHTRNAVKLCIGRDNGIPWTEVDDRSVDGMIEFVRYYGGK